MPQLSRRGFLANLFGVAAASAAPSAVPAPTTHPDVPRPVPPLVAPADSFSYGSYASDSFSYSNCWCACSADPGQLTSSGSAIGAGCDTGPAS